MPTHNPTAPGLVMMYHYVRPDGSQIPSGIRPFLSSEFESQLNWLEERYEILGATAFLDRIAKPRFDAKPPCLLTFDDGTRDHAEVVTPILSRRNLSGVFFVLSWPSELGRMPLAHAVHWLLGQENERVWATFQEYARKELGGIESLGSESDARRIYHYESPTRARIKYAANMALPVEATEKIIERAIFQAGITMEQLAREWFVSPDQIRQMDKAGMTIGMHGCSHRSLQVLGPDGIDEEIRHCSAYITGLIGKRPTWFACPFGGSGAPPATISAMRNAMDEAGVCAAVSTEKKGVRPGCDPRAIPRYDAIDLPPRRTDLVLE